ncbi:phage tail tip lysozyme [Aquamicrobium lusatiense]|uniref:phage tail tip lysozyme n=1 Tax=Aquamicrobium lusatiense TaxID=89772 RepID=UPI0024571D27|nr:phage tail tip lysozyme [Aquamicrobium lusatiense]MDH4993048.1 phage tail tip lysozyme [Aquamicrobium lusatiense]
MALRYPSMPAGGVDAGSIIDMFNSGYDRSKARADERKAVDAFGGYLDSIYSNQGGPQSLSALGGMMQPQQGAVQRTPLPAATDPATARVEQAFAAQGQGSAPANLNSNDIAARFLKTVRDGGVTNPYALAAIASTGKRESGFDPKNAVRTWSDPSQSGQAGTAGGIMSWRNERLQALQRFAQQNGDDPRAPSPETQAKYLLAEDPTLIQKLQNAGSAEEAQQMMNNAWRYAGYDQQGGETAQRMALASQYAQQFGGSPSQQALEGMAVGQSMPMGQGVQMADASGQMMPQGGSLPPMPDRDAMLKLFANPITRPLAVQAAQSRIEAVQNQNDPMARIKYETAVAQLEQLRNPQPKGPTDTMRNLQWRAQQAGLEPGTPEYNQFMVTGGSGGTSLTVGPDGTVQFSQGGAAKPLTEGQSKDAVYATRAEGSIGTLDQFGSALTNPIERAAEYDPTGIARGRQSPEFQKARQAGDEFLQAILRKDTGAAITSEEMSSYGRTYLPSPGDGPDVLEQKRIARPYGSGGPPAPSGSRPGWYAG